jgi:hypothetical protein
VGGPTLSEEPAVTAMARRMKAFTCTRAWWLKRGSKSHSRD